jgi:hypothetical protein
MIPSNPVSNRPRQFQFERFGSAYHLKIRNAQDLEAVLELDEAHWVATTAPTATLNCDPILLRLIDTDHDGRLRAEEIKDAIRFLFANLTDRSGITPGNTRLHLDKVNRHSEIGERICSSASKIRRRLEIPEALVTLEQVRSVKTEVQEGGLDEAGIVLPEAAETEAIRRMIEDIIASVGGKPHPRGGQGVDDASLELFMRQCREYQDWLTQAAPAGAQDVSEIMPLGPATHEAYALFSMLENKIAQFFLLCSIRQLDPDLLVRAVSAGDGALAIDVLDVSQAQSYLADAPLAAPQPRERVGPDRQGESLLPP